MTDLLGFAFALGFGYWFGRHQGFRRGVKACLALAKGDPRVRRFEDAEERETYFNSLPTH